MYEKHFGLKKKPFGTKAEGPAVFVGPRQAKTIASLQKGVGAPDAVVTVTGPVGTGKTTIVDRALETLPTGRTAARIGRMQLTQKEVADLVMGGFGIKKSAGRSIQRFAAFRRILQQQRDNGIPVAIVIEDAQRLGVDALAEVEALTAADTGDTASGNIILMGHSGLHDLLMKPELGRLKQRVRLRLKTETLSSTEVQGYLKHVIREAGGDYDAIFDAGVADIVYRCSEGIPRMINTLCETAMTTAMEENSVRVSATLMRQVATEAFGYDVDALPVTIAPAGEVASIEVSVGDPEEDIDWEEPPRPKFSQDDEVHAQLESVSSKPAIGHDIVVESGHYPMSTPVESPQQETVEVEVEQNMTSESATDDIADDHAVRIPELINDTQPELPRLDALAFNAHANIPLLDTLTDESDIESTQTLAQPVGLAIDEAVGRKADAELAKANSESGDDARAHFDLDAALSPDVESTNVMPGLTTNLDSLAPETTEPTIIQEIIEPVSAGQPAPIEIPDGLDLPTLSDSMRIDVKKEVDRASDTEPAVLVAVELVPEPVAEQIAAPEPEPEMTADAEPVSAVVAGAAPESIVEPEAEPEAEPEQEMIPETESVSVVVAATAPEPAPKPEPKAQAEPGPEPELIPEPALVAVADLTADHALQPTDVPNATLDEQTLRDPVPAKDIESHSSDIDSLEAALAAAKNGKFVSHNSALSSPCVTDHQSELLAEDPPAVVVPEITLDKVISEQQAQLAKLDQFRNEIGNVNSLEDVSDDMAETLFGVEFEALAAAAIADPQSPGYPDGSEEEIVPSPVALTEDEMPIAANDASELKLEQPEEPATVNDVSEFKLEQPEVPAAANGAAELKLEQPAMSADLSVNFSMPNDVPLNESAALRIDMLHAMKVKAAAMAENVELGSDKPLAKGPQPEPIERQMNTSITQTLEALNVEKMEGRIAQEKAEKRGKKSGGLFSRFRKSS